MDDALHRAIESIVRENPSREACLVRLRNEGWDPDEAARAVETYFEARRQAARARRQTEEDREILLGRLLDGADLPEGADASGLEGPARERRAHLARRRRRWYLNAAAAALGGLLVLGLAAVVVASDRDLLERRPGKIAGVAVLGLATLASSKWFWGHARLAHRRLRALDDLALRHGWDVRR